MTSDITMHDKQLDEMRGWLRYARKEQAIYGGFLEVKDGLEDEGEKRVPAYVTYGDEVLILRDSTRETVEEAEEVLKRRMWRAMEEIDAIESMSSFCTFVRDGGSGIAGMADPLFDDPFAVYVCARVHVPTEKHNEWQRKMKEEHGDA